MNKVPTIGSEIRKNRNVGYTYFYSPNLNEIDDITINYYDKIQLHDIGNL